MEIEKKRIERATAQLFLDLYNSEYNTHFGISELGEAPDVKCIDAETGNTLFLEISLLDNLEGDIAHELGRGKKPISPTTGTPVIDFFRDVVPRFRRQLEKKMLSSYNEITALVYLQVSILWDQLEWIPYAAYLREAVVRGKENRFGAGIWVICSKTLICISPPIT